MGDGDFKLQLPQESLASPSPPSALALELLRSGGAGPPGVTSQWTAAEA